MVVVVVVVVVVGGGGGGAFLYPQADISFLNLHTHKTVFLSLLEYIDNVNWKSYYRIVSFMKTGKPIVLNTL